LLHPALFSQSWYSCCVRTSCHTTHQALLAKQGRASQFASQEERDQHLHSQVAKLEKAAAKHAQQRQQLQAQEQEVTTTMMNASSVSRVNHGQQWSTIHVLQSM
jgi:hypothetical protein